MTGDSMDDRDTLSIVVQGGLFGSNLVETANHTLHWRTLFPDAQIILAISSTDLIASPDTGVLDAPALAGIHRYNSVFQSALDIIRDACDLLILAEGAMPLPPIKTVTDRPNNVNLQIATAKAGLAAATGRRTLRVRSDLLFMDRSFLEQHAEAEKLPRGKSAVFQSRVLISNLYTLNPYTYERMPLHFSDWFHFGLTADIQKLWDVPPMTLADAMFYKTNRCLDDSTRDERQFLPRLAVEQHILYNCFKKQVPELTLDYHNDRSSIELSLDILADNFTVCDLNEAHCVFDKYGMDFQNPAKTLHCIMRADWLRMAVLQGAERYQVLKAKQLAVEKPESQPFPRIYPANGLSTHTGERNHNEIVGTSANGTFLYGPYDTLPAGDYLATINTKVLKGSGVVHLKVTLGAGRDLVAEKRILITPNDRPALEIPFSIKAKKASGVEVVASVDELGMIVVTGLIIEERKKTRGHDKLAFPAVADPMKTDVGARTEAGVKTTGSSGCLLFGPYMPLKAGRYRATFRFRSGRSAGDAHVDVAGGPRHRPLCSTKVLESHLEDGSVSCEFALQQDRDGIEFRIWVDRQSDFEVAAVEIEELRVDGAVRAASSEGRRRPLRSALQRWR